MVFEENKKTPACDILYCNKWQKVGSKVFSEYIFSEHILILSIKVAWAVKKPKIRES